MKWFIGIATLLVILTAGFFVGRGMKKNATLPVEKTMVIAYWIESGEHDYQVKFVTASPDSQMTLVNEFASATEQSISGVVVAVDSAYYSYNGKSYNQTDMIAEIEKTKVGQDTANNPRPDRKNRTGLLLTIILVALMTAVLIFFVYKLVKSQVAIPMIATTQEEANHGLATLGEDNQEDREFERTIKRQLFFFGLLILATAILSGLAILCLTLQAKAWFFFVCLLIATSVNVAWWLKPERSQDEIDVEADGREEVDKMLLNKKFMIVAILLSFATLIFGVLEAGGQL